MSHAPNRPLVKRCYVVAYCSGAAFSSRDGALNLTYLVVCDDAQTVNEMVDRLKASLPVVEISLLQQEPVLGG